MKATLDCLACIAAQAVRASRVATNDISMQRRILDETVAQIPGMDMEWSPAALSSPLYHLAGKLSGNPDPYAELKRAQNAVALAMEDVLRQRVRQSRDPLDAALHLAAAGNIIDLGVQTSDAVDIHAAIEEAFQDSFAVNHMDTLRESLASCRDLLYLLDNAGEIVFDKILIEELQQFTSVTAVVKAGPIINDVMMADAEQVGLTKLCEIIDNGGAYVGAPLNLVPQHFLDRMTRADVIIGKGQGNYETVDDFPGNVFLILRAKCECIARHMGVRYGQIALISTRVRNAAVKNAIA